ncbi:RES family NAD+ phosphorylase [Lacrimispora sp.]|uniref:RES family NAD+ phosphorylase n=1 Tax=Lacrimispora sp. TaxID=2719234 RepID=UPI0028A90B52|nr:RES family NAD+ phosphorylase [Lacrimispora sp.]
MLIGINCFRDIELRSIIGHPNIKGICEITGEIDVAVYDTDEDNIIKDYISEILNIYSPASDLPNDFPIENLNYIEHILFEEWEIFNTSRENIKRIVIEICKDIYTQDSLFFTEKVGMEKLCDFEFLRRNSLLRESSWEKFMSSIKNINRFHSNHINLELLNEFLCSPQMQRIVPKDSDGFFRARISDENGIKKEEMGPPPAKKATAGRANSAGISCLYLSNNIVTTLHEIRARDLDHVSMASFKPCRELNIVDLSNLDNISPFSQGSFDYEWFAINMSILKKISTEIAKPLRRQDSDLDYLPAQYISDFVKSLGFDGICYRSSLNKGGLNYAFFDYKKFKCIDVKLYHIKSMNYEVEVC